MTTSFSLLLLLLQVSALAAWSPQLPHPVTTVEKSSGTSRRDLLTSAAGLATSSLLLTNPAFASSDNALAKYVDEDCKFSVSLPSSWEKSEQALGDRRKITLYIKPDSDKKTLVSVVYTPVRADFTSLGSFGTADEVGQATILPKGAIAGNEGIDAKLLSAESKKAGYYFDYYQEVPGQPKTHFRTIFSLTTGPTAAAGGVLVSVTAQTPETDYDSMKPLFEDILNSYTL
ncbi:MAG: hypothetical protein SGBAC_003994 [Bacillariaceae sp.]